MNYQYLPTSTSTNSTSTNSTSTNSTSTNSTSTNSTSTNSTSTNSTSTNSTSDPFTATVSYGVIDTEEAAPIPIGDCIGWKNLPLETQGRALWGPVKTNGNYQPWAYYEGGMFYGVGHNISNWDDQECGIRSPVGDLLPGEYKWAALSEPESTPTSQNILQFSSSIIVEDTTPPVITVPNNIIASATLAGNQVVPLTVTAIDNVGIAENINGQGLIHTVQFLH